MSARMGRERSQPPQRLALGYISVKEKGVTLAYQAALAALSGAKMGM